MQCVQCVDNYGLMSGTCLGCTDANCAKCPSDATICI